MLELELGLNLREQRQRLHALLGRWPGLSGRDGLNLATQAGAHARVGRLALQGMIELAACDRSVFIYVDITLAHQSSPCSCLRNLSKSSSSDPSDNTLRNRRRFD